MPVTGLRGRQILDGDVLRNDLNITTSGSAVTRRIIAGTNISLSSTGVDTGTGDVTINVTGVVTGSGTTGTIPIWSGTTALGNSPLIYDTPTAVLTYSTASETGLKITGDGAGFTQGYILLETGTNVANSPSARGLGTYYFNHQNDVIWYIGNAYGSATTSDTISFIRLSSATFNKAAADPNVGTRLFYIDVNKSVFLNQIQTQQANNTATGGGQIYLNGASGNRIDFNTSGIAAPSFTTRSLGTKLVLYPVVNATNVDYAIGIDSSTLWFSIPTNNANSFVWYGGQTPQMELTNGNVRIGVGAGVGAGRLTINAATGGTSLYLTDAVNSTLIISHPAAGVTRFTNGAAVLWMQEAGGLVTIGKSTSAVAQLFVYNDNLAVPSLFSQNQSTLTTLQDSIPLKFTDLYNSGTNGHNLFFNSSSSSGSWEYNITKTYGGILTFGVSTAGASLTRQMYLYSSGQLRLANYTTTTSFTGTAIGVLAFTSDGSIITIATPGGGSGLTGTGTTNYITKFTGSTSVGNSILFDNGTDIGMGTATPTTTTNYTTLHINGASGGLLRFSYAGNNTGTIYGSSAETGINAPAQINLYVANVQIANAQSGQFNTYETFYARKLGSQIQIAGGVGTASGIFQAGNNLLFMADWATGLNGIVTDVGNGVFYTRASSANGGYIAFQRSGTTIYGYVGNSAQLGAAGYNSNTELGLRSEGGINFLTTSGNPLARMESTGQLRLPLYTTTTSFTGTLVGYLGFTSTGQVITTAAPSGSSQWTTSGVNIYYTTGGVSIGTTTTSDILHIGRAAGNNTFIRFDQLTRTTWKIGQAATTDPFVIHNASAGADRVTIQITGQMRFNAYTAYNSFSATDAQGILGFDTSGNIISMYAPIYRHSFVSAAPVTVNNIPSNISFFASSNTYVTKMDLTGKKRARLHGRVSTAGTGSSVLRVRYALTFTTTASSYLTMGSSEIEISLSATGHFDSGWINLVTGAKADVFIALLTNGGDGAADPVLNQVVFEAEE
jgi:hypothetical protein